MTFGKLARERAALVRDLTQAEHDACLNAILNAGTDWRAVELVFAIGQRSGLEMAAKICDKLQEEPFGEDRGQYARHCAAAIREAAK